jgi:hypothetical protein
MDRFNKFLTLTGVSRFFHKVTLYVYEENLIRTNSGQFSQMSRIRGNVAKIGMTKGPAGGWKDEEKSHLPLIERHSDVLEFNLL